MENELKHYGILGMKWGVRRYQPYSTTGPRKGGKTGKEIGEAGEKRRYSLKQINEYRSVRKGSFKLHSQDLAKDRELEENKKIEQVLTDMVALKAKYPKLYVDYKTNTVQGATREEIEAGKKIIDLQDTYHKLLQQRDSLAAKKTVEDLINYYGEQSFNDLEKIVNRDNAFLKIATAILATSGIIALNVLVEKLK